MSFGTALKPKGCNPWRGGQSPLQGVSLGALTLRDPSKGCNSPRDASPRVAWDVSLHDYSKGASSSINRWDQGLEKTSRSGSKGCRLCRRLSPETGERGLVIADSGDLQGLGVATSEASFKVSIVPSYISFFIV